MNEDAKTPESTRSAATQDASLVAPASRELVPTPVAKPPAVSPAPKAAPARRTWRRVVALIALAAIIGGGGYYGWLRSRPQLPLGIASGNGRIEADEIDIDTKFAGRISEMLADEGDMVKAQQVLARMDARDIEASLKKSESQVEEAQQALEEAHANVVQQTTQVTLAQQEFDRTNTLVQRGFATNELLDQRKQALTGATAALVAAQNRVGEAERAKDAATHDVELYKVNIADNTLVAPRDGRIQYRIANIGEVLPAGGASSPCSTSPTSTWTSISRPRRPAR